MANADVPLEIRQKLTGRASKDMNKHYTHLELETREQMQQIRRGQLLPGSVIVIIPTLTLPELPPRLLHWRCALRAQNTEVGSWKRRRLRRSDAGTLVLRR